MEIHSPPYPTRNTNPSMLLRYLSELHEWVTDHKDWVNEEAERLNAPEDFFIRTVTPLPLANSQFFTVSVEDMYMSWRALRDIREQYDDLVRNYEEVEEWESDKAIFLRANLVKAAALLLEIAFLDSEKREAREFEMQKKLRKKVEAVLRKQIGTLKDIFDLKAAEDDDEIDFDRLFNPEDPEQN